MIYICPAQIADAEQQRCVADIEQAIIRHLKQQTEIPAYVNGYNFRVVRNFYPNSTPNADSYSLYLIDDEDGKTILETWSCSDLGTTAIVLASFQKAVELLGYYEVTELHMYNPPIAGVVIRGEYVCYN